MNRDNIYGEFCDEVDLTVVSAGCKPEKVGAHESTVDPEQVYSRIQGGKSRSHPLCVWRRQDVGHSTTDCGNFLESARNKSGRGEVHEPGERVWGGLRPGGHGFRLGRL